MSLQPRAVHSYDLAFPLIARHISLVLRYFYLSLSSKDVMKDVSSIYWPFIQKVDLGPSYLQSPLSSHDFKASQSELFISLEVP